MASGMPELGSKISLISKADIRYEGRLFTVDPQECTIALANVRSFGTEERETQFPVAPQNQVYEYILFRGSDIKDIRVVNAVNSLPNDPAIVQMTVPQSIGQQPYPQQSGYGLSQIGTIGNQYNQPYGLTVSAVAPMMGLSTHNRQTAGKATSVLEIMSSGSRATTPTTLITRKSPTIDQGIQVTQEKYGGKSLSHSRVHDKPITRINQIGLRDKDSFSTARPVSESSHYSDGKRDSGKYIQSQQMNTQHPMLHGQAGRASRGSWLNNRINIRSRGTRGRSNFRSGPTNNSFTRSKSKLKFDNDYDFEQANTEFEELRLQLLKTKLDGGRENEKKDDSGNETGAGDCEPEEELEVIHYDKSKSFFDNISCEAVERSKGKSQRTDWRTERKLNSETFGMASMRRGNFRGRAYYTRGMAGGYRGNNPGTGGNLGYRGTYRGRVSRKSSTRESSDADTALIEPQQPHQSNRILPEHI